MDNQITGHLKPRLLRTAHGIFGLAVWDGVNRSGITPVSNKVLIMVDKAMTKVGSVEIPGEAAERHTLASTTGVIVATGATAFEGHSAKPGVGDRAVFTRYAGQEYTGLDGEVYRVMDDGAVGGTMTAPVEDVKASKGSGGVIAGGSVIAAA